MAKKFQLFVKNPETGKANKVKEVPEDQYDDLCKEWRDAQIHGLTAFIWEI